MRIRAVHQFHPVCETGDAVTGGMFLTRRLLRELGFQSEIFCERMSRDLAGNVKSPRDFKPQKDQLLLVHQSAGDTDSAWLESLAVRKILVRHQAHLPHSFTPHGEESRSGAAGARPSGKRASDYLGAICVTESCKAELLTAAYANVAMIPLLTDIEQVRDAAWDASVSASLRDAWNLLSVDPICESGRQLELVEMLGEFLHFSDQPARLILAGDILSTEYRERIAARSRELGLENQVILTGKGKVAYSTLLALYRNADASISMTGLEDLDTASVEAMAFDVPVLPRFMDGMSWDGEPSAMAASLHLLLTEPALRRRVIARQRGELQRYSPARLREQLAAYLRQLGVAVSHPGVPEPMEPDKPYWQIEGPFDSTYSLAIVNRELARALAKRGNDIGLRSMEGTGDFAPSQAFLDANPDCAKLAQRASTAAIPPDAAMRFCYPPHVEDMQGNRRIVHSYGWEETGFPAAYAAAFNRKLDLITVLSTSVEKILRDNGVRIPIAVTGGGVDHLLDIVPQMPSVQLRGFAFLHISSCFPRKGIDALLWAYGKAFRNADDVSLLIKTFPNPHNDVADQLRRWREEDPEYPHVILIDGDCSQQELVGLYKACHAFVAPSRGEGLGLPMAEAMLFNLPVITTAWGGQLDFCDTSTAWLCDYQFAESQSHFGAQYSVWADPDVDHLARLLQEVRQLPPHERQRRTEAARRRILRDFTWERVAQRTEQAIHVLEAQALFRNEPRIGWLSTWNKRCGIAAYSSFLTVAIPPERLTILADRVEERTAQDGENVARVWNLQPDEMLEDVFDEITARGIGAVVIQYNLGFFPGPSLGRLIERLKQAGIAVHCFFHATSDIISDLHLVSLSEIAGALAQADRLYVHSVLDLNRLKKHGLVNNVTLFPQGMLAAPVIAAAEQQAKRDTLGLQGKKVIAAYGFLFPHKGMQYLLHAFGELANEDSSLHLLMVTALYPHPISTEEEGICRALIQTLGLAQRVTMITEFLPEAECLALLQLADFIVYPYQRTQESSSAAVRMGLATGRPVAVTPLAIFDDVSDAVHTLPGTDAVSIAAGMRQLLNDTEEIQRQAARTAKWIAGCQWPALSVRLLNLIDGIANPLPSDARRI